MYLNNKQIIQLLTPFLVAFILFYFQDDILTAMRKKLPHHTATDINTNLNIEATQYLQISKDKDIYNSIIQKANKRKQAALWLCKNFIYKKKSLQSNIKEEKIYTWKLEAVFPKYNMAIINTQFVHTNSIINKAKVVKITFDGVLLKTTKGLQWVHLFR